MFTNTPLSDWINQHEAYLLQSGRIATLDRGSKGQDPTAPNFQYGLVEDGSIAISNGIIDWVGPSHDIPEMCKTLPVYKLNGLLVTPAPIDFHTHLVHGGNRADEFEQRLHGASYQQIAQRGGGILSTVHHTRSASVADLIEQSLPRLDALIAEGVTTIEIKSGYGLSMESELTMLRAARRLSDHRKVRIQTTLLAAHALPPEYQSGDQGASRYVNEVCIPTLQAAFEAGLVDAVDGFCENIAFSPEELEPLFAMAVSLGLPVKLHTEQLSSRGGARLAAQYKALSADHLEYLDEEGVKLLASAGTVAGLLPGAFYTLREKQLPPVSLLRAHGVPMALATDCNPGSSPLTSILLTMNMGCTLFQLTPAEALMGTTVNAAKALGLNDCGMIKAGLRSDLAIWKVERPAELVYRMGYNPLVARIFSLA